MAGLLGGGDEPQVKKQSMPDYGNYWKQYKGWIQNINDRNKGELANVRARLSAAGASPDQLMMQTEQLESQRKSEIAKLEGGQTKRFLDEAYEIASGKRPNPYAEALPGMDVESGQEHNLSSDDAGNVTDVDTRVMKRNDFSNMEEYFTKYFDGTVTPDPVDAGVEATKRAKMAAGGGVTTGAAAGGGGPSPASAVFGSSDDTFWR